MKKSGESSRAPPGARTAIHACRYFGALLVGALAGAAKQELLSVRFAPVPSYWERNPLISPIAEIAAGSFKSRKPPVIAGTGYVVKSLEAAPWAFPNSGTFRDG